MLYFLCIFFCFVFYLVKGLFWCLIVSVYIVGGYFFFLIGLLYYLMNENINILKFSFFSTASLSTFNLLYTYICK
jgi:hypothetical protein